VAARQGNDLTRKCIIKDMHERGHGTNKEAGKGEKEVRYAEFATSLAQRIAGPGEIRNADSMIRG
jgi:hypothetical protein